MSDELKDLEKIEEVKAPEANAEFPVPFEEEATQTLSDAEPESHEETEQKPSEEPIEEKAEVNDELPLPGDELPENKKPLPKWVEKKLSKREQELQLKEQELAQMRAQMEQLQNSVPAQSQMIIDPNLPKKENYASEGEYIEAVIDYRQKKDQAKQAAIQQQTAQMEVVNNFRQKLKNAMDEGSEKYEDFEEKIKPLFSPGFPENFAMAQTIMESPYKGDILYFLGNYEDEARKIAQLKPIEAVRKIVALEARFEARKQKTVSKAPPPINGVKTNQVKGGIVNNLLDLDRVAKGGNQKDFENAYRKMAGQSEAW